MCFTLDYRGRFLSLSSSVYASEGQKCAKLWSFTYLFYPIDEIDDRLKRCTLCAKVPAHALLIIVPLRDFLAIFLPPIPPPKNSAFYFFSIV